MYFHTLIIAFVLLVLVNAATLHVDVGKGGALKFDPEIITASEGDIVVFHFYTPHSVVNGPFETPCSYSQKTFFYSGVIDGDKDGNQTYQIGIQSPDPIWLYCGVKKHCQHGMVGVINPPGNEGLSQYRSTAATVANATSPTGLFNGNPENHPGNSTSTGTGNGTATSTGNDTVITSKPTAPPSSTSAAASSTSSSTAGAYVATPEAGSLFVGLMGLIGAAFI